MKNEKNSKKIVDLIFDEKLLKPFDTQEYLTIFALIKIKFLKGNED